MSTGAKCYSCGKRIGFRDQECPYCGVIIQKQQEETKPLFSPCEKCGWEGRLIDKNTRNSRYLCYYCYNKENDKKYSISTIDHNKSKEQADYDYAMIIHFHIPLFYHRQPEWSQIRKYEWELIKSQLPKDAREKIENFEKAKLNDKIDL